MPEMDGFEFLVEMRSRAEWRDIPVLVVTAKDLTAEERSRLNGDVERVLQKGGAELDELLREIVGLLPGSIERGRASKVGGGNGMKILYVEDNDDNVYMLERRLKRAGFDVVIARDGAQGVAMAVAEQPDLILMDLGLPVLDGWEATRQIKAAPETKHIPVIALTAHAMTGDREKALAAGCDDFDTKPVDLPRLLGKIQALAPGERRIVSPAEAALLVVDDNEDNRYTLTRRLKREGYTNLTTANDGREALELLRSKKFDLVLLDIMMPEMNGYEVLEHLKADAELRHLPVIMISAVGEIDSVVRCIELGAEDYLPKPFNPTLLRARVGASLEKKALRDEVRDWNRKLEERVQEQVAQLDRLGRLKSFFSPQLAESIVNGGGEDLLKTHRREVVVVFLDLRGFTAFTDSAEPEEVMAVLGEYHRVMGQLILAHEGTLEHFAGDGILIFFNDPIQLDKPAENAISMALAMQQHFAPLRAAWKKRGFDLDLGIGIAQGYATLGAIGFEGRWEYACIGSVANLASRLCSEAKGGQILINQKTLSRIEDAVEAEPLGEVMLKGIAQPVKTFNITSLKS